MKWMLWVILMVAGFSQTAFGVSNDIWTNSTLEGWWQVLASFDSSSGDSLGISYVAPPDGWPMDPTIADYCTAGLAMGGPLGDYCVSYVKDQTIYLVTYKLGGEVVRIITHSMTCYSTGLAVRFTPSGTFPPGTYPYFVGGKNDAAAQLFQISTGGGLQVLHTFPDSTKKMTGLAFGDNYSSLYCLAMLDDSDTQYCVYRMTDFEYPTTATLWAGPFSVPTGAGEVFDCGYTNGQVFFSVDHGCEYPLWFVTENATTANPVENISWADVGWSIQVPRTPRGVDIPPVIFPWAPISSSRETQNSSSTSIVPEISVSENPFRSSTVIETEAQGTISVYDLQGRLIEEQDFEGSYVFEPRASGVYFVQITDGTSISTTRLIRL